MIDNYWFIGEKGTFTETRGARIGASDVPKILPNPEKPTESLAGYDNTCISLYYEKTGEKKKEYKKNLSTEIGHLLENQAIKIFVRDFFGHEIANELVQKKVIYEMKKDNGENVNARDYQTEFFKHNTEYYYDGMIVHLDLLYIGNPELLDAPRKERYKTVGGVMVDKAKPFYLEAKSATKDSAKRPTGSTVKGYDFDLTTWQGIPLKHYNQMQFQSALMEIDTGYLPLMYNTSQYCCWRIDRQKSTQKGIINLVGKMLKHIEEKKVPKELAICQADIISMYPRLRGDFLNVSGEELEKVEKAVNKYHHADNQIKRWTDEKNDAKDALSVYIKDYDEIKNGSNSIVKWVKNKGSEKFNGKLADIKKNNPRVYRYLLKNGLIKITNPYRYIKVGKKK